MGKPTRAMHLLLLATCLIFFLSSPSVILPAEGGNGGSSSSSSRIHDAFSVPPTELELFGVEKAYVQGYTVDTCTQSPTSGQQPSWCEWVDADFATANKMDISTIDDSSKDLHSVGVEIPLFDVGMSHKNKKVTAFPVTNGFLSLAPYVPEGHFSTVFHYNGRYAEKKGVSWPMIALYTADFFLKPNDDKEHAGMFHAVDPNGDSATVWYYDMPPFESQLSFLNLTASVTMYTNGTVIMKYASIPGRNIPGIVGLFLTNLQRVNVPSPQYLEGQEPQTVNDSSRNLTIYAYRFEPVANRCSQRQDCGSCLATTTYDGLECSWCDNAANKESTASGFCATSVLSSDFCTQDVRHSLTCASPDYIAIPAAKQNNSLPHDASNQKSTVDPNAGFYTSYFAHNDPPYVATFGTEFALREITTETTIDLDFKVPFFYSPKEGHDADNIRMLDRVTIKTHGDLVFLKPHPTLQDEHVGAQIKVLNYLNFGYLPGVSSLGYITLPKRPRSSSSSKLCHDPDAIMCNPTLLVHFSNFVLLDGSTDQRIDVAVGVHSDGTIQLFYQHATSSLVVKDSVSRGVSPSNTTFAQLFVGEGRHSAQSFYVGVDLLDEMRIYTSYPISWSMLSADQYWVISPSQNCMGCVNGGVCNRKTMLCDCPAGSHLTGERCDVCAVGFYAIRPPTDPMSIAQCAKCPPCVNGGVCSHETGQCVCPSPFSGARCEKECPVEKDRWGQPLPVTCDPVCNVSHSYCDCGTCACEEGYVGESCNRHTQSTTGIVGMMTVMITIAVVVVVVTLVVCPIYKYCFAERMNTEDRLAELELILEEDSNPGAQTADLTQDQARSTILPNRHLMTPIRNPLLNIPQRQHREGQDDDDDTNAELLPSLQNAGSNHGDRMAGRPADKERGALTASAAAQIQEMSSSVPIVPQTAGSSSTAQQIFMEAAVAEQQRRNEKAYAML